MAEVVEKVKGLAVTAESGESSGNDASTIEETRKLCVKFSRIQQISFCFSMNKETYACTSMSSNLAETNMISQNDRLRFLVQNLMESNLAF